MIDPDLRMPAARRSDRPPAAAPGRPDIVVFEHVQKSFDGRTLVVHDLNLRVLSSKVRGFIQPQSWYIDLKNVWVAK